jgi:hypothetical protein
MLNTYAFISTALGDGVGATTGAGVGFAATGAGVGLGFGVGLGAGVGRGAGVGLAATGAGVGLTDPARTVSARSARTLLRRCGIQCWRRWPPPLECPGEASDGTCRRTSTMVELLPRG